MPSKARPKRLPDPAPVLSALDAGDGCEALAAALDHAHYRVVARAAELAGERLCYALEPALIAAFRRLAALEHPADPGCQAKGAIARALVALDCLDAGVYREGIALRQPEPVWGGTTDTATDVRASCAMGLAASGDPRALIDLVALLADAEHPARIGAARAIACTAPLAAEAVLRLKVLTGDAEPEVIGECLRGLLEVAPDTAPAFAAACLDDPDPIVAELAALALGESRLDAAVALLRARWEATPFRRPRDRMLLRAAVLARSDAAFDWLLGLVADADGATAAFVVTEMAVYRGNAALRARLHAAARARGDAELSSLVERVWGSGGR
jgi:HEAT repeat protein